MDLEHYLHHAITLTFTVLNKGNYLQQIALVVKISYFFLFKFYVTSFFNNTLHGSCNEYVNLHIYSGEIISYCTQSYTYISHCVPFNCVNLSYYDILYLTCEISYNSVN